MAALLLAGWAAPEPPPADLDVVQPRLEAGEVVTLAATVTDVALDADPNSPGIVLELQWQGWTVTAEFGDLADAKGARQGHTAEVRGKVLAIGHEAGKVTLGKCQVVGGPR